MHIEQQPKYQQRRRSLQQLAKVAVSKCSGVKTVAVKAPVLKVVIGGAQAGLLREREAR